MRRWPYAIGSGALLLAACSGPGNSGRIVIGDLLATQVPWVKGRAPVLDGTDIVRPDEPIYPPIASGKVDPGSTTYDCKKQEGLEFSSVWFDTFEPLPGADNPVGVAQAWASHDDFSDGAFRVPGEINWYLGLEGNGAAWGLPAERIEGAPSCNGETNEWALHYRAGRFNRFGGGMGHPLAELVPCPPNSGNGTPDDLLCPPLPAPGDTVDAAGLPIGPEGGGTYAQPHSFWNVSGFDGIAFWARRGPEGQANLNVGIFDKYTSDDLARQNETYCRRLRSCRTECVNREPCSPVNPGDEDTIYRCFDPEVGIPVNVTDDSLLNELYPTCGKTACSFPKTYPDPDFEGKECQPYTFQAHETGEFCFDPGDPPPPENGERCGDHYGNNVQLTTDWKFYKLPFKELRQQGHGKVSPEMDLTTVSNIIFVTSKGWVDFYLDNVSFYREVK